jgi:hypothetical protein
MFAWLGPLYLAVAWRAVGRSIGGAVAGYAVVSETEGHLGIARSVVRASVTFFLIPVWAFGMIGTAFNPLRRSWGDQLLGSRTPYLVHVEQKSTRKGSEWR